MEKRTTRRLLVFFALTFVVGFLAFKFFEVILVYNFGWEPVPTEQYQMLHGTVETRVFHHHGVAYGSVSHFAVYPDYGVVVSVMMNKNQGSFGEVPAQLVNLFIER